MTGYGIYNLPKGSWSDDSSMMLCLADSIGKLSGIDYEDIMKRFWDWFKHSKYTPDHNTFDIGRTCHAAIYNFHQGIELLECGLKTESANLFFRLSIFRTDMRHVFMAVFRGIKHPYL